MATESEIKSNILLERPDNMEEIPVKRSRGRPAKIIKAMTPEEKKTEAEQLRMKSRLAARKSFEKNLLAERFVCKICGHAFGTRQSYRYHTELSKAHAPQ